MAFWRGLFAFAAIYNFLVGGALMLAPHRAAAGLGVSGGGAPFALAMVGMLIVVFGVGYAMVARSPAQNRGIVWIGLIGKIGAAALGTMQYLANIVPLSTFLLGMGDVVFVLFFAIFLWRGSQSR